jgi:hypothetical protein
MLLVTKDDPMGKIIVDAGSPVSHELLVIGFCQTEAENCDVKEDTRLKR